MFLKQLTMISRKTLAAFMAVWLSGVVFLFCCEKINAETMEAEFCPLARMASHCDMAKPGNPDAEFAERGQEDCVDCCGFLPLVFDKARKIEQTQKQIAVTPKPVALKFTLPRLAGNSPSITAFHSRMPDRQATFVKNCAFRI